MTITVTELKSNLSKYLLLSATEDIYITKNGHILVKLSNPNREKIDILNSLVGAAESENLTLDEVKEKRLAKQ